MVDQRLVSIAGKLLEQSRAGEIDWNERADEDAFSVSFPESSASISYNDGVGYTLEIRNEHGTVVDSLSSFHSPDPSYEPLRELFDIARNIGLKTDEVLDGLLERLSGKETPV